jgi:hypothetical protein
LQRLIKLATSIFVPTQCIICYWGRLALVASLFSAMGTYFDAYLIAIVLAGIAGSTAILKWIVHKYG